MRPGAERPLIQASVDFWLRLAVELPFGWFVKVFCGQPGAKVSSSRFQGSVRLLGAILTNCTCCTYRTIIHKEFQVNAVDASWLPPPLTEIHTIRLTQFINSIIMTINKCAYNSVRIVF